MDYVAHGGGFAVIGLVVLFLITLELRLQVPGLRLEGNPGASVGSLDNLFVDIFADLAGLYGYPRFADGGKDGTIGVESARIDEEGEYGDQNIDAADLEDILIGVGAEGGIDEGCRSDGQQDEDKEEEGGVSGAVEDAEERNAKGESRALDHRGQDMPEGWLRLGHAVVLVILLNVYECFCESSKEPGLNDVSESLAVQAEMSLLVAGGNLRNECPGEIAKNHALQRREGRRESAVESLYSKSERVEVINTSERRNRVRMWHRCQARPSSNNLRMTINVLF